MREALTRGVKVTGATVHFVDEGTDTGPILLQKAVEVTAGRYTRRFCSGVSWRRQSGRSSQAIDLIAEGRVTVEMDDTPDEKERITVA